MIPLSMLESEHLMVRGFAAPLISGEDIAKLEAEQRRLKMTDPQLIAAWRQYLRQEPGNDWQMRNPVRAFCENLFQFATQSQLSSDLISPEDAWHAISDACVSMGGKDWRRFMASWVPLKVYQGKKTKQRVLVVGSGYDTCIIDQTVAMIAMASEQLTDLPIDRLELYGKVSTPVVYHLTHTEIVDITSSKSEDQEVVM